jgi:hypothetical protein
LALAKKNSRSPILEARYKNNQLFQVVKFFETYSLLSLFDDVKLRLRKRKIKRLWPWKFIKKPEETRGELRELRELREIRALSHFGVIWEPIESHIEPLIR